MLLVGFDDGEVGIDGDVDGLRRRWRVPDIDARQEVRVETLLGASERVGDDLIFTLRRGEVQVGERSELRDAKPVVEWPDRKARLQEAPGGPADVEAPCLVRARTKAEVHEGDGHLRGPTLVEARGGGEPCCIPCVLDDAAVVVDATVELRAQ